MEEEREGGSGENEDSEVRERVEEEKEGKNG